LTLAIWHAVTSGGESVRSLSIKGANDPSLDDLGDGVKATGLVQDLHIIPGLWKIDGYTALVNRLKSSLQLEGGRNLFEFAYDWRRHNRIAARKLAQAAKGWLDRWRATSGASDAKLVLVAHSMGGFVSKYFLESMGGWKDTRALVTFGTQPRLAQRARGPRQRLLGSRSPAEARPDFDARDFHSGRRSARIQIPRGHPAAAGPGRRRHPGRAPGCGSRSREEIWRSGRRHGCNRRGADGKVVRSGAPCLSGLHGAMASGFENMISGGEVVVFAPPKSGF
jgi:hypothetical protein